MRGGGPGLQAVEQHLENLYYTSGPAQGATSIPKATTQQRAAEFQTSCKTLAGHVECCRLFLTTSAQHRENAQRSAWTRTVSRITLKWHEPPFYDPKQSAEGISKR